MRTVLIVEADDHALRARGDELLLDGYEVLTAQSDRQARLRLADAAIDAVVLGELDGPAASLALLRHLRGGEIPRADLRVPVLTIGADADQVAVRHYEAGADIVLPGRPSPFLVRGALAALTDRAHGDDRRILRVGPVTIDCDARLASIENRALRLTRLEFDLLNALAHKPNTVMTREQLAKDLWNTEFVSGRTIDSHAGRLRSKLGDAGPMLQTVRGVGYRLSR